MSSPADVVAAVVCEDIRQEISGKFSLAGVFGSSIQSQTVPAVLSIGVFAEVKFRNSGEYEPEIQVIDENNFVSVHGKLKIVADNTENVPLILGPFPVNVSAEGAVRFQWRFPRGKWSTVRDILVVKNPNVPAILTYGLPPK